MNPFNVLMKAAAIFIAAKKQYFCHGAVTGWRRTLLLMGCLAVAMDWSATATAGNKIYVSPTGNDAADGTSKKTAWRTLNRVASHTFAAGEALLLEGGGVFYGAIQLSPDNSSGDIEIGSYNKGRAIIDAVTGRASSSLT